MLHKRYHIQRVIGQGGMGAVYQAKDIRRSSAVCAVKEMSLSMVPPAERDQAIKNFKTEAKMLWGLDHPNLPAFTNFFSENQRYFLVMEYIDGDTLEDLLARNGGPFSERRVLGWARELCDVLKYLHSQNPPIIFRDMKPGNIMLTRQGHIKLIDFGIARLFQPSHAGAADTQLLGTPGYAPPEQYGMAQTDERSDIYSLGMTLYHLLTNTMADQPIHVKAKDLLAINPHVSKTVARALEKATALEADERYQNVEAFWNALSGAGRFVFESGEIATIPQELAELCARYPDEAAEYLREGEILAWLQDIGETDLARAVGRIRVPDSDPITSVEQFLRIVVGPKARPRSFALHEVTIGNHEAELKSANTLSHTGSQRSISRMPMRRTAPLLVSPRLLDFGPVYPGISAPLTITINGDQGLHVSGDIYSTEPWIKMDRTHFDGMSTYINVRINSIQLQPYNRYTGTIVILPDSDNDQEREEISVTVAAEIQGYSPLIGRRRPGKTNVPDLDEEDEDDEFTTSASLQAVSQISTAAPVQPYYGDLEYKYKTVPTTDGSAAYWEPNPLTAGQQAQQLRYLSFAAAFMAGSLVFTILSNLIPNALPPGPPFTAILALLAPATTLGALLISRNSAWRARETINRLFTGVACSFVLLALINAIWNFFLTDRFFPLQLFVVLLSAALAATWGSNATISANIMKRILTLLRKRSYMRRVLFFATLIAGGILGACLTFGLTLSVFTAFGILVGIGAAFAMIDYVNRLLKSMRRP